MRRAWHYAVGHLRALRGRCPGCDSVAPARLGCGICHGHAGPFPPAPETRARWVARFERAPALRAVRLESPVAAVGTLAAHRP
jgi:hypothetical protein